jgi:hypothetical protein
MGANYRNQRWLHHDRTRKPIDERKAMTVCIASLFQWNYGTKEKPNYGLAALTASDRMLTIWDSKFEPHKTKVAFFGTKALAMISGDYALHSEAVDSLQKTLPASPNKSPENIALLYGRKIQEIKLRRAENLYLAPLGMNSDSFLAQQGDMSENFIDKITRQMQNYDGDEVEALIVASDDQSVSIYGVDTKGTVTLYNDVGFAAIGIGGWHARSRLMQMGYHNSLTLAPALAGIFAAKRAAEIAPGVGDKTDLRLMTKEGHFPLWEGVDKKLYDLYNNFKITVDALTVDSVQQLQNFIDQSGSEKNSNDERSEASAGTDAQVNGGPSAPTAEAPRENEGSSKTSETSA